MKLNKNQKGFTLIELLIVITIIGILAVAFLPSILGAPAQARDSQRIASVGNVAEALALGSLNGDALPTGTGCMASGSAPDFANFIDELGGSLPVDPLETSITYGTTACAGGNYLYSGDPDAAGTYSYGIIAKLENLDGASASQLVNCSEADDFGTAGFDQSVAPTTDANTCYYVLGQ